jgi:hypothetical protein
MQPEGRKPPTIRIPSACVHSGAGENPTQQPQTFLSKEFRLKGAVVRTLFPPCKRCNSTGRLCTLEVGAQLLPKTPRCCSPCKVVHLSCLSWMRFSNAFEEVDDEVLRDFRLSFWKHLGQGSYSPLLPDPL